MQYAPALTLIPGVQVKFWHCALDYYTAHTGAYSSASDASDMSDTGKGGVDGKSGAGSNAETRRANLLRVITICEANIFGETMGGAGEEETVIRVLSIHRSTNIL